MTALRVTAPLVLVRDERGCTNHCYENAVVDVLDADHAAYLLMQGMAVPADGTRPTPATPHHGDAGRCGAKVNGGDPAVDLPRPPHVAPKDAWIEYAVAQGFDVQEASAMTKAQLVAALS